MRRKARVDANQAEIVAALREIGASVLLLHTVGGGCPDLMVGYGGVNYLLEVKTPTGKPNATQVEFLSVWRGQVAVAHSVAEALVIISLP